MCVGKSERTVTDNLQFEYDESESFPFGVNYRIKQLSVEMRASMEPVTNRQCEVEMR